MKVFVELTNEEGKKIHINVDHIVSFGLAKYSPHANPAKALHTWIQLVGNDTTIFVKEYPNEILAQIPDWSEK